MEFDLRWLDRHEHRPGKEAAMKPLDRQKLDVVSKTRSNLFGWRACSR